MKWVTWLKRIVLSLLLSIVGALGLRLYDIQRGPELQLWHTWVPHEMDVDEIDNVDWNDYINKENALFSEVKRQVTDKLDAEQQTELNRYYSHSPIYPDSFPTNWDRSYIMMPDGKPKGVVVLLHGLTGTPYSLRHIAEDCRQQGYIAIGIRLPGHGTVPAGLTDVDWQDWLAATRLVAREVKRLTGNDVSLHIVGFSNDGALAMRYSLDALDNAELARPQRVILISLMIGITSSARFSDLAGWLAFLPAFSEAAWLNITPESNLFKYNSFLTNVAR